MANGKHSCLCPVTHSQLCYDIGDVIFHSTCGKIKLACNFFIKIYANLTPLFYLMFMKKSKKAAQ